MKTEKMQTPDLRSVEISLVASIYIPYAWGVDPFVIEHGATAVIFSRSDMIGQVLFMISTTGTMLQGAGYVVTIPAASVPPLVRLLQMIRSESVRARDAFIDGKPAGPIQISNKDGDPGHPLAVLPPQIVNVVCNALYIQNVPSSNDEGRTILVPR